MTVFTAYLDNLFEAHRDPVPGTIRLLERLAAEGHLLLALTNAQVASVAAIRQTIPEMELFQDVLISAEEKILKPDAEVFERLLQRNDIAAAQALFVDDSAKNVAGAQAVGLDAVLFTDAGSLERDLLNRGLL